MLYDQDLKYKWDNKNAQAYVEKKALEQGIEQVARD